MSNCFLASSPMMMVQQHVVEDRPRVQQVPGSAAASSVSEIAMPRNPGCWDQRLDGPPAWWRSVGLAKTSAPQVCIMGAEGLLLVAHLTMKTRTGRPNIWPAKAIDDPTGRAGFGGEAPRPPACCKRPGVRRWACGAGETPRICRKSPLPAYPGFFQAARPAERRRPPERVDLAHFFGNGNPALGRHFLFQ